jgi:tetratricopeptide (TPR) repeat protein
VTSRNRLATLSTCARVDLGSFTDTSALALFTRIVGAARAETEPAAVERVLDACSGLPLAIRIAAARLVARPKATVAALADRLADVRARLDQLEADDLGVRAAFATSYERLAPATGAADVFRSLGLWPTAEVGTDAVAALLGRSVAAAETALDALSEAQLVEIPAVDRYRLHDLLRVYAHERAVTEDPPADRDRILGRVVAFYLHSTSNAGERIRPQRVPLPTGTPPAGITPRPFAGYAEAVAWAEVEQPNVVAAIRVAEAGKLFVAGWQLAFAIWPYYYLTKRCDEWLDTAAAGLRCAVGTGDERALGAALWNMGTALCESHRYDEAVAHYLQALEHQRAAGDADRESSTLNSLAVAYAESGRPADALGVFSDGHELNLRRGEDVGATMTLFNMALCNLELGRPEIAIEYNRRVVEEFRRWGDQFMEAVALANLAEAYASVGADDLAAAAHHDAIALHELVGNRHGLGRTLTGLGRLHAKAGHLADARGCWLQALAIFEELGHPDADEARDLLQAPVRASG